MKYEYICNNHGGIGRIGYKDFPIGKPKRVKCSCGKYMQRVIGKPKFMLRGEGFAGPNRV